MRLDGTKEDLEPFRPGIDGAWDTASASHLVRRAAFGAPPETVRRALELGPRGAADDLLSGPAENDDLRAIGDVTSRVGSLEGVQAWWVYRMLRSPRPALEKLALFWHGHFATSARKVEKPRLMMRQIELFHRLGAGRFDALLLEMARDPAMVIWLDGNSNRRGHPNENFARELMELFSLGIGNYSESDIKEAARAFTGWHVRNDEFWFNARAHDQGAKRILGAEGTFGGEEAVGLCSARPACSRFIAAKLFRFYAHPDPSEELVGHLAERFDACGRSCGDYLRLLWSSRLFFRPDIRRAIVASPADFAVGSIATLDARASASRLAERFGLMGQDILRPPSVKGWDGGPAWINSTTLLARYRFAVELVDGGSLEAAIDWPAIGAMDRDALLRRFFPEGLAGEVHAELVAASGGDPKLFVAGCLQLPEYQYI